MEKLSTMRFTYHNHGTIMEFDPFMITLDLHSNSKRRMLAIQKDEVKFRNDPNVYILDHTGQVIEV